MQRANRGYRLLLAVGLLTLAADQGSKYLALSRLTGVLDGKRGWERVYAFLLAPSPFAPPVPGQRVRVSEPYPVHPDYWHFRYVENPGAAWGLWSNLPDPLRQPFFLGVSLLALGFISYMYSRATREQRLLRTALALVIGGALGNFMDRLVRGYVIDFIDWHWRNTPGLRWPTFNVADAAISVGVALILAESLRARSAVSPGTGGMELAPGAGGHGA